jgi:hypothetical protein
MEHTGIVAQAFSIYNKLSIHDCIQQIIIRFAHQTHRNYFMLYFTIESGKIVSKELN